MAAKKIYYLTNPSGIIIKAGKAEAEALLQRQGFAQVTDKAIIAKAKKQAQSLKDGTNLGKPFSAPTLVDTDEDGQ